jgi:hypothetical protein
MVKSLYMVHIYIITIFDDWISRVHPHYPLAISHMAQKFPIGFDDFPIEISHANLPSSA